MAPTKTHKARLARLQDPTIPSKLHRPSNAVTGSFIDSKRDRRQIRRSAFISRITKPAAPTALKKKTRRPSKKLVATLESLADALAELEDDEEAPQQPGRARHRSLRSRPGALKRKEKVVRAEVARFGASMAHLESLRSGEVVVAAPTGKEEEMDTGGERTSRKDMNVDVGLEGNTVGSGETTAAAAAAAATSAGAQQTTAPRISTANRWAALRGFITATMEQNPAFTGKS